MKYIDLQINGCFGIDFNSDELTIDDMAKACSQLQDDGIELILATLITDDVLSMVSRIRRLAAWCQREQDIRRVIGGIHVEGPFISSLPGFVGAHPVDCVRPASIEAARVLVEAGEGLVRLVTLAPEQDPQCEVIHWLTRQGIIVAAGHTDASIDQLRRACDAGLTLFTHLGNGCPRMIDRHDNIIQRVLSLTDRLTVTLIADGFHVPWFFVANVLKMFGSERTVLVSDATAAAGQGPGVYRLGRQSIESTGNGATYSLEHPGYLGGSATLLRPAIARLGAELALDEETIAKLVFHNPRRLLPST